LWRLIVGGFLSKDSMLCTSREVNEAVEFPRELPDVVWGTIDTIIVPTWEMECEQANTGCCRCFFATRKRTRNESDDSIGRYWSFP
jgi:hypothetical protein